MESNIISLAPVILIGYDVYIMLWLYMGISEPFSFFVLSVLNDTFLTHPLLSKEVHYFSYLHDHKKR